jgi:superoxide reductase
MSGVAELYQTDDWKKEKHVPVIEMPEKAKKGEFVPITVSLGKEIAHPNETAHHISWIEVYFHPEGSKFPYQIGRTEFNAHGESAQGPDTSGVYTHHEMSLKFRSDVAGTVIATSLCNIHGLWQSSKTLKLS